MTFNQDDHQAVLRFAGGELMLSRDANPDSPTFGLVLLSFSRDRSYVALAAIEPINPLLVIPLG